MRDRWAENARNIPVKVLCVLCVCVLSSPEGEVALPNFFFCYFFPVQEITSGIGHRVEYFFLGWQPIR